MRDGWEDTTLGAFITQSKKKVKVLHGEVYPAVGVMMEGRGFVTREPFIGGKTTYKQLTPIEPNQLVLRSITAWEAPIQVTTDDHVGFHVSGVFPVFDIDSAKINPRFLGLHCQYNPFWESMRERTVGSVLRRKTLSAKALMEIPIELPPLPEQQRIVDLISSVDSYIDALRQQLEKAKGSRGAVLHELLTESTDGWAQETLSDVSEVVMGRQLAPSKKRGIRPRPYIRAANIGSWGINLDDIFMMDFTEKEEEKFAIQIGDTLLVEGGNEKSVGCPALVSDREAGLCIQNTVIRCRSKDDSKLDPDFQYYLLRFMYWRGDFAELCAGTTIMHLGQKRAALLKVSLPPLEKQREIVEVVSSFDTLVNILETANIRATKLRSGLLFELLSGEHEIPASYDQLIGAA